MAETSKHTVTAFDDELSELRALISQMGGLAEAAIGEALQALVRQDNDQAMRVIDNDRRIDALEMEIEALAVRTIALRAPMADDLRDIIAALKISSVLERIGDYAKNIAKRSIEMSGATAIRPVSIVPEMGRVAAEMVKLSLDAYAARDSAMAATVCERDKLVDDFYTSLFRTLLTYMMENPHHITAAAHLLFIAKHLERIGDHATNMAEMVYYSETGTHLEERARSADPHAETSQDKE